MCVCVRVRDRERERERERERDKINMWCLGYNVGIQTRLGGHTHVQVQVGLPEAIWHALSRGQELISQHKSEDMLRSRKAK